MHRGKLHVQQNNATSAGRNSSESAGKNRQDVRSRRKSPKVSGCSGVFEAELGYSEVRFSALIRDTPAPISVDETWSSRPRVRAG